MLLFDGIRRKTYRENRGERMKKFTARAYGLPYFLPSPLTPGVSPAVNAIRVLMEKPAEARLPENAIRRGRKRFLIMSKIKRPTESRRAMLHRGALIRQKLAITDMPGYTHYEGGRAVDVTASQWHARMRLLVREIDERLEALNERFSYEVLAVMAETLRAKAERDAAIDAKKLKELPPPTGERPTCELLTDTIVIAPGAPGRN
jgi:hypothetical protein